MTERVLMAALTLLVGFAIVGSLAWRLLRKPGSGAQGGSAAEELKAHAGAPFRVLRHMPWFLYVPMGIAVMGLLAFRIPQHWSRQAVLRKLQAQGAASAAGPVPTQVLIRECMRTVSEAGKGLMFGYKTACHVCQFATVGAVILFFWWLRRLRGLTQGHHQRLFGITRTVAIIAACCMAPALVAYYCLTMGDLWQTAGPGVSTLHTVMIGVLQLGGIAMLVTGLFLFGLLEAGFLLCVRASLEDRPLDPRATWNHALSVLPSLIALQALWVLVASLDGLPLAAVYAASVLSRAVPPVLFERTTAAAPWLRLVIGVVAAVFCAAPFFVVARRKGALPSLESALTLIRTRWRVWLPAVALGLAALAPWHLIQWTTTQLLRDASWGRVVALFLFDVGQSVVGVAVAIFLFSVFLSCTQSEDRYGEQRTAEAQSG